MMAAPVSAVSGFTVGTGVALPVGGIGTGPNRYGLVDASSDGREFLVALPVTDTSARAPMNVVLNWTETRR